MNDYFVKASNLIYPWVIGGKVVINMFQHYVGGRRWNFGCCGGSNISGIKSRNANRIRAFRSCFLLLLFGSCWGISISLGILSSKILLSFLGSGRWKFASLK